MTEQQVVHRVFLNRESTIQEHVNAFVGREAIYCQEITSLVKSGINLSTSAKVRAAAVAWKGGKKETTEELMSEMNVSDLLGLLRLLDADRVLKSLDKKLETVKHPKKVAELKRERTCLSMDKIPLSGPGANKSFMKRIKKWTIQFPEEKLEYFLLNFPKQPWKDLADLAHLHPKDFRLNYFLPCVFGAKAPEGTMLHAMISCLDTKQLPTIIKKYPNLGTCYSFLRSHYGTNLPRDVKVALCSSAPLSDLIWFYEELTEGAITDEIITGRLARGEELVDLTGKGRNNFGKLMERLLFLKKRNVPFLSLLQEHADKLLSEIKIPNKANVAVIGDASSSMSVAVESATIIGSIICSCLNGSLNFFNTRNIKSPCKPKDVSDILKVLTKVYASGGTTPAASLMPFYKRKEKVDLFIMVTDEEENGTVDGMYFANLFKKYIENVHEHAQVFFVSFLRNYTDEGYMVKQLKKLGLGERVSQFKFNQSRPDLTKITNVLGLLSVMTQHMCDEDDLQTEDAEVIGESSKAIEKNKKSDQDTTTSSVHTNDTWSIVDP